MFQVQVLIKMWAILWDINQNTVLQKMRNDMACPCFIYNKLVNYIYLDSFLYQRLYSSKVFIIFWVINWKYWRIIFWTSTWCSYTRTCAERCALRDVSEKMKIFRVDFYPCIVIPANTNKRWIWAVPKWYNILTLYYMSLDILPTFIPVLYDSF